MQERSHRTDIRHLTNRTWAEVDLAAVTANLAAIRAGFDSRVLIMAVVKADGYGHGAVPVARAALRAGATWLGVATVDEGVVLRRARITASHIGSNFFQPPAYSKWRARPTIDGLVAAPRMIDRHW